MCELCHDVMQRWARHFSTSRIQNLADLSRGHVLSAKEPAPLVASAMAVRVVLLGFGNVGKAGLPICKAAKHLTQTW